MNFAMFRRPARLVIVRGKRKRRMRIPAFRIWRTIGVLLGNVTSGALVSRAASIDWHHPLVPAAALRLGAMRVDAAPLDLYRAHRTEFEIDDVPNIQMAA